MNIVELAHKLLQVANQHGDMPCVIGNEKVKGIAFKTHPENYHKIGDFRVDIQTEHTNLIDVK